MIDLLGFLGGLAPMSSAAPAALPAAASLNVPMAMPQITTPASVTPLSQQIGSMQIPNLTTPPLGGQQTLPSLGVDTSMPTIGSAPGPQGPSLLQQLNSGGQNLADLLNSQQQQGYQPMQWSPMPGSRNPVQLQQADLLGYLNMIGGQR